MRSLLGSSGFTLIEALLSVIIAFFIVIGVANLLTFFQFNLIDRTKISCLVEAAASGIEACKAGEPINSVTCNGLEISINVVRGSCTPAPQTCNDIVVSATLEGETFSLQDIVCGI